jgi:excisionase family DNA binding protein
MNNPFEIINSRLLNIEALVLELHKKQSFSDQPESEKWLTLPEVAKYLDLAHQTIYGLVSRREIPHIHRGKKLYFRKSEIDTWLSQGRRKTVEELKEEIYNQ